MHEAQTGGTFISTIENNVILASNMFSDFLIKIDSFRFILQLWFINICIFIYLLNLNTIWREWDIEPNKTILEGINRRIPVRVIVS